LSPSKFYAKVQLALVRANQVRLCIAKLHEAALVTVLQVNLVGALLRGVVAPQLALFVTLIEVHARP